jgi:RNA polymerase sigma factor (sigma-70 family)
MMHSALRRLPARQRAVIVLRYYDDMSEQQTAEALGCPVGTVKSLTFRALARLRELGVGASDDEESEAVVAR